MSKRGFVHWKTWQYMFADVILWNYYGLRDLLPFVQFKNVKNNHGGVLLLVKLQAEAHNASQLFPHWKSFMFEQLGAFNLL